MYRSIGKRMIDIVLSLVAVVGLFPVLLGATLLIYFKLGTPVFFRQKRPGKNEKIFEIFKFRTMTDQRDDKGNLLPDEARLTWLGKWLRSTSVDELPELINIIKGDMSIVGPRPLLVEYLPRYNNQQKRRHEVRPGLSGLAQVMGRNTLSWEEKFKYDVEYVDNISFWLDVKIICLTLRKVFRQEGISSNTSATMEIFKGSNK